VLLGKQGTGKWVVSSTGHLSLYSQSTVWETGDWIHDWVLVEWHGLIVQQHGGIP